MDLSQRLDEMELAIHKPSFRKGTGRANEVNYWVFDYPPEKELEVRERVEYLKNKNDRGDDDFELVFAINVLKTLFLIKYVLEIEANVDNIVSLMITSIDDDRISLKAQVEDALKVLMRQMLIQKNGSIYVFLTDEEQEINNEIEKENVEMPEVITKIAEMIYEDIFSSKKYQYPMKKS